MSAEKISDALNYLDEDLIRQADEVRQGKRVLYRPGGRGMLAAACAALLLGGLYFLPRTMNGTMEADRAVQNEAPAGNAGEPVYGYTSASSARLWEDVEGPGFRISIPEGWKWELLDVNEYEYVHLALIHGENKLILGRRPSFGVCGTGLETVDAEFNGIAATIGTYDNSSMWSFIRLHGDFVVQNNSGEDWTEEERADIDAILNTITIMREEIP